MAQPYNGKQLQAQGTTTSQDAVPRAVAPESRVTARRRVRASARCKEVASRALSCFMAVVLVATMNPMANDLSAFAVTSGNTPTGGGSLNEAPAAQVEQDASSEAAPVAAGEEVTNGQPIDAAAPVENPAADQRETPAAKDTADESAQTPAAPEEAEAPADYADDDPTSSTPADSASKAPAADEAAKNPEPDASSADEAADESTDASVSYATWADIAAAIEDGTLEGDAFKPSGTGTAEDPYAISTPEAFAWWAAHEAATANAHAKLTADIDLTSRTLEGSQDALPWPGDATLAGQLDGEGHAVVFATTGAGLFKEVAETGAARWIVLGRTEVQAKQAQKDGKSAAEVASQGSLAGSIAAENKGEVQGVVNLMPVTAAVAPEGASAEDAERIKAQEAFAGGIVAQNDGTVKDCANLGAVANAATKGNSAAAGIAAQGKGTIATSYNAGNVKAAQNGAYIATLLTADGDYASVVDEATCYLAEGEGATYDGIAEAGKDRPGALNAADLQQAAERLNAGREGEAAAWAAPEATDGPTQDYPAPAKPANPDAQPAAEEPAANEEAPAMLSAEPRATYTTWYEIGKLVDEGAIPGKPTQSGLTEEDPYLLGSPEQLAWAAYIGVYEAQKRYYRMTNDIDMAGLSYSGHENDGPGEGLGNCLIWTSMPYLSGTFDGDGYSITSVRYSSAALPDNRESKGIIVKNFGIIKNLTVESSFRATASHDLGGIVLANNGTGRIENCSSVIDWVCAISGIDAGTMGGIANNTDSPIVGCSVRGTIDTSRTGTSTGYGGIVSELWRGGSIVDCYSVCDFKTSNAALGVGGLVGEDRSEGIGTISRSYSASTIDAPKRGGLVGVSSPLAANCTKTVWANDGGLLPRSDGTPVGWDVIGAPLRTMQSTNASFGGKTLVDYLNDGRTDGPWIRIEGVNNGLPFLKTDNAVKPSATDWAGIGALMEVGNSNLPAKPTEQPVTWGDGTAGTAYVITQPEQLAWFAYKVNNDASFQGKNAQLGADIDLSGLVYTGHEADGVGTNFANCLPWVGIDKPGYTMHFDGAGFQIKNLVTNNGQGFIGLIGGGTIERVGLASGLAWTSIDVEIGTLARDTGSATVKNCYSLVDIERVEGDYDGAYGSYSGALVGCSTGTLANCYYAGTCNEENILSVVGEYSDSVSIANVYVDGSKNRKFQARAGCTIVTSSVLKSVDTVVGLANNSAVWSLDTKNRNGGYPVVLGNGEHPTLTTWDQVARLMDKRASGMPALPEEKPVSWSDGIPGEAYVISAPEQLAWFAYKVNNDASFQGKNAQLAADIDLSGLVYTGHEADGVGTNFANCLQWSTVTGEMSGRFDGNGYVVKNVRSSGPIFKTLAAGGVVENFGITASRVEAANKSVSGENLGAIVGSCAGTVRQCFASADVAVVSTVALQSHGGLVGALGSGATLENCWTRAQVSSAGTAGGMVGESPSGATLTGCYSAPASISGSKNEWVGLFSALNKSASVTNCFYKEQSGLAGVPSSGGGTDSFTAKSEADMKTFQFAKDLNGGKFVGDAEGTSSTTWTTDEQKNGPNNLQNDGFPVFGILERTALWEQIAKQVDEGSLGSIPVKENFTLPGETSLVNAYKICTAEQLAWFAYKVNTDLDFAASENARLMCDVDLSGLVYTGEDNTGGADLANCLVWAPIGATSAFGGIFDGNGHTVSNMRVTNDNGYANLGLIGETSNNVMRVNIASSHIDSGVDGTYLGAVVGKQTAGSLERCGVGKDVTITASAENASMPHVGGLVGQELTSKGIADCWSRAALKDEAPGGSFVGGLAGWLGENASTERCYSWPSHMKAIPSVGGGLFGMFDGLDRTKIKSSFWPSEQIDGMAGTSYLPPVGGDEATVTTIGDTSKAMSKGDMTSSTLLNQLEIGLGLWLQDAAVNDGFPTLATTYISWDEVGLSQFEERLRRTKAILVDDYATGGELQDARPSNGSYLPALSGAGTIDDPYILSTPEALAWWVSKVNSADTAYLNAYVELGANIDLAGLSYSRHEGDGVSATYENCLPWVSVADFAGQLDGKFHTIRNLSGTNGLFAKLSGVVMNVGLKSSYINRPMDQADMQKKFNVGGIVGETAGSAQVQGCFAAADVTMTGEQAVSTMGGLVGELAAGTGISDCWSRAALLRVDAGRMGRGGVVGKAAIDSSVSNCYSAAVDLGSALGKTGVLAGSLLTAASNVTNCYFQALDGYNGANGPGATSVTSKTQAEMTTAQMADDLNNSRADGPWAWRSSDNDKYPVLAAFPQAGPADWSEVGAELLPKEDELRRTEVVMDGDFGTMGELQANLPGVNGATYIPALSGSGDLADDPLTLYTPEALAWYLAKVNSDATYASKHVALGASLDMAGLNYTGKVAAGPGDKLDNCLTWKALPSFKGTFDGVKHTISNLRIEDYGFFNVLEGPVSNLTLEGYASGSSVGAFAYCASENEVVVTNCVNRMTVEADTLAAGFIAMTKRDPGFYECANEGKIALSSGLENPDGVRAAGGIVAYASEGSVVRNCYNTGSISGSNGFVGGIVGSSEDFFSIFENCFNVGPLAGVDGATLGDIEATENDTVKNCYASTTATQGDSTNDDGSIRLKHLTEDQMKTSGFALNLNGNTSGPGTAWTHPGGDAYPTFGEMTAVTWEDVGGFVANDEGTFGSFKPTEGDGSSSATPLELGTPEALGYAVYMTNKKHAEMIPGSAIAWSKARFKLVDDISLSATYGGPSTKWVPMGDKAGGGFQGGFNGQGHVLSDMTSEQGGFIDSLHNGYVSNVAIENSSISGSDSVGALVNKAKGEGNVETSSIVQCSVAETVTVSSTGGDAGGLIGWSIVKVKAADCWSRARVTGKGLSWYAGGFAGRVSGESNEYKNCYSAPSTLPKDDGLVSVFCRVNFNAPGVMANCYAEKSESGIPSILDGNGWEAIEKTAAEMRTPMTALALNNKATGASAHWTWNPFKNDAYPLLGVPPIEKELESWAAVGQLQTEDDLRYVKAEIDPATGYGTTGELQANLPGVNGADYTPALSGEGSAAKPFVVSTPEALAWFAYQVNSGAIASAKHHVKLGANLDLAGTMYTGKTPAAGTYDDCLNWVPIGGGGSGKTFQGTFQGDGKVIRNLRIDFSTTTKVGLIGIAGTGTEVTGLGVESGKVSGKGYVGGFIGYVNGVVKVSDCWNAADIVRAGSSTSDHAGGLVGGNDNTGSASLHVEIDRCFNRGSVTSNTTGDSGIGGIAGYIPGYSTVTNCYNTGNITGAYQAGGIFGGGGVGATPASNYARASNCYNMGIVGGAYQASSAIAAWKAFIDNSFTLAGSTEKRATVTGAPVILDADHLKSWGAAYALNGGDGTKMPSELKTWRMAASASDNGGFPVLVASGATGADACLQNAADWGDVGEWVEISGTKKPTAGTGVDAENAFEIDSPEALAWFAHMVNQHANERIVTDGTVNWNAASVKLTADINLQAHYGSASPLEWVPISNLENSVPFKGVFDGADHSITSLSINSSGSIRNALIGNANGATLRNLHVQGSVKGKNYVAALIAMMKGGTIEDCTAEVDVVADKCAGGLVGEVSSGTSYVTRSSHQGSVTAALANDEAGGLVGTAYSHSAVSKLEITDCYHRGDVTAQGSAGGLFGRSTVNSNNASIKLTNSYAAGTVKSANSFGVAPASPKGGTVVMDNCLYDASLTPGLPAQTGERALSATEMLSPVTALMLNAGRSGASAPWGWDVSKNDKYPLLGAPTVDMSTVDWSHVGAIQDEGMLRKTAAVIDSATGFGSTGAVQDADPAVPALSGNGTPSDPYVVRTPEALAWFAYQVNNSAAFAGKHNVQLGANIDLQGVQYTGTTGTAAADSLQWSAIGKNAAGKKFSGSIKGEGHTIDHLYINKPSTSEVGLVGWADKVEISRLAIGENSSVTGNTNVSAFVGACQAANNAYSITNCFNRANVSGTKYVGSFLGDDSGQFTGTSTGTIENCYNTGNAIFAGVDAGTVKNCFGNSKNAAVVVAVKGGKVPTAITDAQLQSWGAAYQLNGGDGEKSVNDLNVWRQAASGENGGYPVLIKASDTGAHMQAASDWSQVGQWVDVFSGKVPVSKAIAFGDKTSGTGFELTSAQDLAWFAYKVNDGSQKAANAVLKNPVTLAGYAFTGNAANAPGDQFGNCLRWVPIGIAGENKYTGHFDGLGNGVRDMRVDQGSGGDGGFFGVVGAGAKVENAGVDSGYSTGTGIHMGGFLGYVWGAGVAVTGCWNNAEVSAGTSMGGVVGTTNEAPGTVISKCWNTGKLVQKAGKDSVGGIVGKMYSGNNIISNCYNRGEVQALGFGGGIVGNAVGSDYIVTGCYNAGKVSGTNSGSIAGGGMYTATFNYYANDIGSAGGAKASTKGVTSDQLRTWGAAYALSGGDGTFAKNPTTLMSWRCGTDTTGDNVIDASDDNAGFPTLTAYNATGDAAHLQPAANWGDVGAWVDVFATGKKPTGDGSTGNTFKIDSAEKLAWFAHKVNSGLAAANQNAQLTGGVDLSGYAYTGNAEGTPGANYENCLIWASIGAFDLSDGKALAQFQGRFDGAGFGVSNFHMTGFSKKTGGLFGYAGAGSVIEHLAIQSGAITQIEAAYGWGTLAGLSMGSVANCYSKAELVSSGDGRTPTDTGGLVGVVNGGEVSNCYFAGSNPFASENAFCIGGKGVPDAYDPVQNSTIQNVYYVGDPANDANAIGVSSDQLASWGAAYQLNGASGKLADMKTWRKAADASENDGYPVLIKQGDGVTSLQPAATWGDVGLWVDAFAPAATKPTANANGSYAVTSAPQLAWFAYKVNSNNSEFGGKAVMLDKDINLFGGDYTDQAFDGAASLDANLAKALPWTPIGDGAQYFGTFDGQQHVVRSLVTDASKDKRGLVGLASCIVKGVTVSASAVHGTTSVGAVVGEMRADTPASGVFECAVTSDVTVQGSNDVGGVVGYLSGYDIAKTVLRDVMSRATVLSASQASTGGIVGSAEDFTVESSYFAGAVPAWGDVLVGAGKNIASSACYYYDGVVAGNTLGATPQTLQQMTSRSGADLAMKLNNLRTGDDAKWRADWLGANDRMAVLASALVVAPADWAAVGKLQDEDDLRRTIVYTDANGTGVGGAVQADLPGQGGMENYTPALSGEGTAEKPYVLRTPEALAWFTYMTNDDPSGYGSKHVQLGESISLVGDAYTAGSGTPLQWKSIMANGAGHGKDSGNYSGTFDGAGKVIDHLYQHNASAAGSSGWGLIAFVSAGVVTDVVLDDVDIDVATSSGRYVTAGGIASQLTGDAKVQRCAVRSGSIKASSPVAQMTGGIAGDVHLGGGSVEDCFVRANVGENVANRQGGGMIGRVNSSATIDNCYFAGTAQQPIAYNANNLTCTNVYYDATVFGSGATAHAGVTGVTSDQLASWGAAYQLNAPLAADGTQKTVDALSVWRQPDVDANGAADNDGYPVLLTSAEVKSGTHMDAATSWAQVGAWVDAFGTDVSSDKTRPLRPQETDKVQGSDGSDVNAYGLSTPEQLAWYAYKVNSDNDVFKAKNAALTAPISLHGGVYTGNKFDDSAELADNLANALAWDPMAADISVTWHAAFDGRKLPVSHLTTMSDMKRCGLFGFSAGAIKGVGIVASHIKGIDNVGAVAGIQSKGVGVRECTVGADVVVEGTNDNVGGVVGSLQGEVQNRGIVEDVMSRASVKAPAGKPAGGLVGSIGYSTMQRNYFAGTVEVGTKGAIYGKMTGPYTSFAECYYLDDGSGLTALASGAQALTADQLASWGAAYQLNAPLDADGKQKQLVDLSVWRQPDAGVNDGYPVLTAHDATGADAHMQPAANWGQVGAWVAAFGTDDPAKNIRPQRPQKTAKVDGVSGQLDAYALASAEDLAWLMQVKPNAADAASYNAAVTQPLDLSGTIYTGASGTGSNYDACLEWTARSFPGGVFDGGGQPINNLYQSTDKTTEAAGLFDTIANAATVRRVALASGSVRITKDLNSPSGTLASSVSGSTVENCYSRVAMHSDPSTRVPTGGFVGNAMNSVIDNSYYAGTLSGATVSCFGPRDTSSTGTVYTDQTVNDAAGVEKMTTAQLQSWRGAFTLNDDSFVGKMKADGMSVGTTVWTVDDADPQANDGYPVFGNLSVANEQELEFPANNALDSSDGTVTVNLTTALKGKVELADAPNVIGLMDMDAGNAALTAPADVKAGFTSWGTDDANSKIGLTAGSTAVLGTMAARSELAASGGVDKVHMNLAAAYNCSVPRTMSFVAMDDSTAYRIKVTIPEVTSKTLDVTVPVEGGATSFDITPDAKAHTLNGGSGKEAAKAKAASVFENNGKVPVAGAVSKVEPLALNEAAGITEVLAPGKTALVDTKDPITNAGNTRLGITTAPGDAAVDNTQAPVIDPALVLEPGANGAAGTIPLYFAVQGSTDTSKPNALAWQYFLEYTGTYLKDGTKFGFSTDYEVYLPKGNVGSKAVVSKTKLDSGGGANVTFTPAALALAAGARGRTGFEAPADAPMMPGQVEGKTGLALLATKEEEE